MNLNDLANLGQIVGAIGVMVTLAYLANSDPRQYQSRECASPPCHLRVRSSHLDFSSGACRLMRCLRRLHDRI